MRHLGVVLAAAVLAVAPGAAQEFQPPRTGGPDGGTRLGLFGFGLRAGADLTAPTQVVLGATLDLGDLLTPRVRLRPSGEIGVNGHNTYVASLEGLFRFTGDDELVVPYLGGGVSVAGRDDCGADPGCPGLWVNAAFGFELKLRSTFSWLLEYHGMDLVRRHRVYLGLTTRRGN